MSKIHFKLLFFVVILSFQSCDDTNKGTQESMISYMKFNNDWKFTIIDNDNKIDNKAEGVQKGSDWDSQFNVEHVSKSNFKKNVVVKDLNKTEFNKIESWSDVQLPHTAYIENYELKKQWEGVCFYKKNIKLKITKNEKAFIKFGAAMQVADIWINGNYIKTHYGGYLPFTIDISKFARENENNEIVLRLDNRDNPLVPPGKPIGNLDFAYYSGLYRNVYLIKKNNIYITDEIEANKVASGGVFVTYPSINKEEAIVNVKVNIKSENNKTEILKTEFTIFNKNGDVVSSNVIDNKNISPNSDIDVSSNITVKNPVLWSMDNPYLYKLKVSIYKKNEIIDTKSLNIGLKYFSVSRKNGFILNGKPIRLIGTNRHMDYPWVGNALPNNAQRRDIVKIKNAGFNLIRLGHYPQAKSVYDACDELGILIIDPIPGWQFFNKDSIFISRTYRDIQQMIRRDRNHVSVLMWEIILNESWPPKEWKDGSVKTANAEFPKGQFINSGDMYGYDGWDVLYNDWKENHTRPSSETKPGFIREYGDYEFGGGESTTRVGHKDGEKAMLINAWNWQWSHNKHRSQYPSTIGDANWSMYDYNRGCCEEVCESGISDLARRDKFGYYFYRSQISVGTPIAYGKMKPEVYIANYWTPRKEKSKVIVYGNVEMVKLFVNGKLIKTQKPDDGPNTLYATKDQGRDNGGNPFDGGNANQLKHPPFTFTNIEWEKGELKAIGYIGNKQVCEYSVMSPEKPESIQIELDKQGVEISNNSEDLIFVRVKILDKNGTICVLNTDKISIDVEGAELVSPSTQKSTGGVASFLIKTDGLGKNIRIKTFSNSLSDDKIISRISI